MEQRQAAAVRTLPVSSHLSRAAQGRARGESCHQAFLAFLTLVAPLQVAALDDTVGVARTFSDRSLLRCADSLADFVRGYLALHGLQDEAWRLLPVLLWLEASIYTLDETNEESIADVKAAQCDESAVWKGIKAELQRAQLLDQRVEQELAEGARYWRLERTLCRGVHEIKESDVERCATGKSFDYRLMHAVALRQCGMRAEDSLLEAMKCYEAMIETRDDVTDWAEDEQRGSFNVILMLARIHGRAGAREAVLKRVSKVEARYKAALAKLPAAVRQRHENYVRAEKGGAWLWESIVPHLERETSRGAPEEAKRTGSMCNEALWNLSDSRKAVAVLRHAWSVIGALLGLPGVLPLHGPVLMAAVHAARPRANASSQLQADGSRYLRSLQNLQPTVSVEEVWRLCRWRSFDTLMILEAVAGVYMVTVTDALRALVLSLDVQTSLAADWQEFKFTSVRDADGGVTLCSLHEDTRQLNAALLLYKRVPGAKNIEQLVAAHIEENHQDALRLLTELQQPRLTEAYNKVRPDMVKSK